MSRRQREREQRRAAWWAAREADADAARVAAIRWDQVRAAVRSLPAERQDTAWRQVAAHLTDLAGAVAGTEKGTH